MDIATRFQPQNRAQTYLDRERERERNSDVSRDESESLIRCEFRRTADTDNSDETFRKPSVPASAARASTEQRPSFTHRRQSTLRDHARVPSGPREVSSPAKRVASGSSSAHTPSMTDATNNARSFLPPTASELLFSKGSFADPSTSSAQEGSYPTTPATNNFDFVPTVNFDDFQNSLAGYGGTSPLLSDFPDFPTVGSGRAMPKESNNGVGIRSSRPPMPKLEPREESGVGRSGSLRKRLGAAAGVKQGAAQSSAKESTAPPSPGKSLSLRAKRQSAVPQLPQPSLASYPAPPPVGAGSRAPRKSIGPGVIASMMDGRRTSQPASEPPFKLNPAQTGIANKTPRRITMQPSASAGAEPRVSTFTATTQSRANKVKSLQAPPREPELGTPNSRSVSKGTQHRAHTPSSSGSKRQSTASGRASGLGARTISPTDARRLKRLSMMQAPPMPTNLSLAKEYPMPDRSIPQEDFPPLKLELPRFTQASPSLIPRKASSVTPTSARASPELQSTHTAAPGGGVTLSSKSSFSSLLNLSSSTSRLPTLKARNVHSSSAQYGEDDEVVPPVPAIPKAFESPRENDQGLSANTSVSKSEHGQPLVKLAKPNRDATSQNGRKPSSDSTRTHQRMNTIENIERSVNMTASKPPRQQQFDNNGRKNSNLQPLRLPPLNLMPITATESSGYSRPSQDGERQDDFTTVQTPEPKRIAKTPSTPMTASKATFFRRHDEDMAKSNAVRSASSHFALRDLMQRDESASRFFDDAELDLANLGVPVPSARQRNAITPFASGSLPKASGEFIRQRVRASGDDDDYNISRFEGFSIQGGKPQGPRASRSGTNASIKTSETQSSHETPVVDSAQSNGKKESGIRRKLSMGWHRASSKATNSLSDLKSSPAQDESASEQEKAEKQKKRASEMPPPKLPASAIWAGDVPSLPVSTRASLDSVRGKSRAPVDSKLSPAKRSVDLTPASKTKSMHNEQPQPVNTANRASSWGQIGTITRSTNTKAPPAKIRQAASTSSFSAMVKDKDDLAADEEMRRLSQKRRDVDSAAKESEELRCRAVARSAMTPETVLKDRNSTLNIFERGEIIDYGKDGVYFTGNKNARKIIGSLTASQQPSSSEKDSKAGNYGYDDERGDYNIVMGDHLAYRYEVVDLLGKGSFGQVVRCVDHKDGGVVAVKIIRNKKRFHQQALVEVGILGRLRDWDPEGTNATLSITSSFYFRSHLCIVTPCLSINLYELIRSHNFVGFSLPLIRRFSRQLLSCLVLLQNKRIIHCDLKPENILLCEARKADVRVIDFGSSCKEEEKVYTYIQSRFYRSPEVILGSSYGLGIDMWSLGCILAELWTGYPLFPGENEQEQLACIMEIFGPPDRHLVDRCTRKKLFFDSVGKPRVTVSSKGRRRRPSSKTLSQALKSEDEAFLDFIARCLRWDPDRRLKPHEAIHHAFITNQPFHQRPGIPDEARRAARVRAAAAVPTSNGNNIPSPVKRGHTTAGSISHTTTPAAGSFAGQQATPAKERHRPLPDTPQTALRSGAPNVSQGSPIKGGGLVAGPRRQSAVVSVGATNVKRSSQGLAIGMQRQGSGVGNISGNNPSLAQLAAREASAARWRG